MHRPLRLAALLSLLSATPLVAQEKGGLLSINTGLMVWTVVIFVIVLLLLYRFAYPHILGAVEAREQHIRELLGAAARDREEAQALLERQKEQIDQARAQVQEMLAEGRAAAEHTREKLVAEAQREQAALLERTQRDVHQQMERALEELRVQAVDIALAAAARVVEHSFDAPENRRLVEGYLRSIEPGAAAPGA